MASNTANPYTGNIVHGVHPDVVDFFITDYPRHDYPANVNRAIEMNRDLASNGYRCEHTNGNHTVWMKHQPRRGYTERIVVSRCELPTVTITRIPDTAVDAWTEAVDHALDAAADRFYSGE
jgi:hypothetical protein